MPLAIRPKKVAGTSQRCLLGPPLPENNLCPNLFEVFRGLFAVLKRVGRFVSHTVRSDVGCLHPARGERALGSKGTLLCHHCFLSIAMPPMRSCIERALKLHSLEETEGF